jgi:heat shock protein HslJ
MKRMITVTIIILVLLSACTSQTSLVDTKWQVVNLDGETALEDITVTLNFGEDSIGGNDGCNVYGGSYTATESTIQFGSDLFSTEMYCTEKIMTQSTAFYNVLSLVTDYKADSQLLTLFNADGKKLAELIPVQE